MPSRRARVPFALLLAPLLALAAPALARAQGSGAYDLRWSTFDAGGGASAGGAWSVVGTAGQPDAGPLAGGAWSLSGGFWSSGIVTTDAPPPAAGLPATLRVYPARPNPFVGGTVFTVDLPAEGAVAVRVYDVAGKLVRTLHDGVTPAGRLELHWDAKSDDGHAVAAGVYFTRVVTNRHVVTSKVALLSEGGAR